MKTIPAIKGSKSKLKIFCITFFIGLCSLMRGEDKINNNNFTICDYESRLEEIDKIVAIKIRNQDLMESPEWNGFDFDAIPVQMKQAIEISRNHFKQLGCDQNRYILMECSLVRNSQDNTQFHWYWEVSFVDAGLRMMNAKPVVIIPVLFSGKVPERGELTDIERDK